MVPNLKWNPNLALRSGVYWQNSQVESTVKNSAVGVPRRSLLAESASAFKSIGGPATPRRTHKKSAACPLKSAIFLGGLYRSPLWIRSDFSGSAEDKNQPVFKPLVRVN